MRPALLNNYCLLKIVLKHTNPLLRFLSIWRTNLNFSPDNIHRNYHAALGNYCMFIITLQAFSSGMNIFLEWAADHLRNMKKSRANPVRSVRSIKGKRREKMRGIKQIKVDNNEIINLGKEIATSRF